jgi:uncharacterized repeat protein (TIGR03803 family)
VTLDSAGNLYGTTAGGGAQDGGVVYKIDSAGHETVVYRFTGGAEGPGGWTPSSGVIRDAEGDLYGTTEFGGRDYEGVVYKLDTSGNETVLYSFTGGDSDGGYPFGDLVRDPAGNLYGTSRAGVYMLDTTGRPTLLHAFRRANGGVIRDPAGNLYGVNGNAVYMLDTGGQLRVLYDFENFASGSGPTGVIRDDSTGEIYGTTYQGGENGAGVVFALTPQ